VAAEKARNEARVKQLEALLSAKEKMLAEADKFYRQKQLELDSLHASLNQRVSEFNEDLFAQKQALADKPAQPFRVPHEGLRQHYGHKRNSRTINVAGGPTGFPGAAAPASPRLLRDTC